MHRSGSLSWFSWSTDSQHSGEMATAADTTEVSCPQASLADKLRLAASKGLVDKVNELLQSGASFEPDRDGRTALHYAALSGFTTICKILIDEGCDVDSCDSLGYTALHRAAAQGHLETIKLLADEGCSIDRQDEVHGNTALHEAAWNGFSKSIELIIKNKSNVFVTNKAGFTALHLAAQNGHNESARILLYRGCSPDMKNNYGDTPLHTAARYGHAGVTRILLSAHCAVSEQNKNGDTALHISAALKRRKIAKILMEAGIDPSVKNKQNETAVDVARRKEHPEIIIIVNQPPRKHKHHRRHDDQTVSKKPLHGPIVSAEMSSPVKEEKEKRGFFKRKKKDKDKDKTMSPQGQGHAISPGQMPQVHGSHPHQHHMKQGGGQQLGLFSKYVKKEGVQYYRDLAGNIRQGPVGFTPSCQCMPMLQKLEQRVEADRHNFYDHVDVTQQHLEQKIDDLERLTTQQVYSVDKLTRERLDAEKHDCHDRIERRVRQERLENDRQNEVQGGEIKTELKSWMANRMREHQRQQQMEDNFGTTPANLERNVFENNSFRRKKGERRKKHENDHFAGRLFRSRSDETISHSEYSYHGKAYKSRKSAMQQLRALQLSAVKEKVYRFDRSVSLRPNPVGETTRPKVMHEEAGSSPYEAFKTISEQSVDSKSTPDMSAGNFSQRRDPIDVKLLREFEDSELEKLARPHDSEVIKKKEATPEPSVKNKSESKIPVKRYPVNSASGPVSSTPYFSQNRPMLSRAQYAHQNQNTSQSPHHYHQMAVPPTNNTYSGSSLTRSPYGYQTSTVRPNIQTTADVHQSSANYAEINSRFQSYAQINRNSQNTTDQDMNVQDYVDTSRKSLPSYSNSGRDVPPYSDSSKLLQSYPATRQLHNYEDISKSSLNYSDISNRSYQNYADISSLQSSGISGPDSPLIPHCALSGADSPGQKTESGSNPDSGYGSRIYGQRPGSGPPPLPPRPMQSPVAHEYNSSHNLSVTTNMSSSFSSPQNSPHLSGTSDANVHQATHYHDSVSEEMEKWYQRHMRDVHVDQHRVPSDHGNYSQTPNRSNYNNFMGSDV